MSILHKRTPVTARSRTDLAKRLKTYGERFLSILIGHPYADGPASVVNFERAMQGTRTLAK
jgi:hypothetical protein